MSWSVELSPMLPGPVMWVALAVAALLVGVLAWRRSRGAALRALSLIALMGALANPTLREEERESLSNIAVIVTDESTSQTIAGRAEQTRAVKAELEARLAKIKGLQVRSITSSKPGEEGGRGTNLFTDLNKSLADVPPDRIAGVIMITDGQVHDVPKQAAALGFDAPVHALLTGAEGEFDRRIEILKAPRYGLINSTHLIEMRIAETGRSRHGNAAILRIRRQGQPEEVRRVEVGRQFQVQMRFPHAGQNIIELDLEPVEGELTTVNNRAFITAEGVREHLRVLLVSGEPHAGERVWRNLLKSDAAVDLVHFTILRPPQKQDGTPINQLSLIAFPTRELFLEKINEFDLIIFDRYQSPQTQRILPIDYFHNIARYVERHGGALLIAAGDDFAGPASLYRTPLSPVLPAVPTGRVIEQPFKATISEDGAKHPVTQGLPQAGDGKKPLWGNWYRLVDARPDRGRTIMQGAEDKPLLVLDRKGRGRVALLLSDHAWLWARGYDGGGPHTDLLRRLSHWLMKEPDLEEERLIATAKGMKLTIERRSMEETVPPVIMTAPTGDVSELRPEKASPGLWRLTLDARQPGLHKFQSGQLTALAHAGVDDPREMSEVHTTDTKMKPILEATGGGAFYTRSAPAGDNARPDVNLPRISMLTSAKVLHGSGWLGLKDREAHVTRGVKVTPMFTGLLALAALLALITLAWWREGK